MNFSAKKVTGYFSRRSYFFMGFSILTFAYLPGVLKTSFYSDDFVALSDPKVMADTLISDARPVWGIWNLFLFEVASDYSLFNLPKVIGFLGIIVLYLYMSQILKELNLEKSNYLIISLALLLPSFSIWAHWSISSLHSWGAVLGIHSFYLFKKKRYFIAVAEMAIACLIYPPSALFFIAFIYYIDVTSRISLDAMFKNLILAVKLVFFGVFTSVVTAAIAIDLFDTPASARVGLVEISDFVPKLVWFYSHPFALGFYPGTVQSPGVLRLLLFALPTFLLVTFAILWSSRSDKFDFLKRLGTFFIVCNFTIVPLLFSKDNQIELRLIPGLAWVIFALALLGLFKLLEFSRVFWSGFVLGALSLVFAILMVFGVHQRFNAFYLFQYEDSSHFIRTELEDCIRKGTIGEVYVIGKNDSFPTFQNLGTFSSSSDLVSPWVPVNKIKFILKKDFDLVSDVKFVENFSESSKCTIDINDYGLSLKMRDLPSLM
jgi:hypothetical protein